MPISEIWVQILYDKVSITLEIKSVQTERDLDGSILNAYQLTISIGFAFPAGLPGRAGRFLGLVRPLSPRPTKATGAWR